MADSTRLLQEPGWRVAGAEERDEADLRRILRTTGTGRRVRLSFEREPSFFRADASFGGPTATAVCRDEAGRAVGLVCRTVRPVWVDGTAVRAGFLHSVRPGPPGAVPEYLELLRPAGAQPVPFDVVAVPRDDADAAAALRLHGAAVGPVRDLGTVSAHVVRVRRQLYVPRARRAGDTDLPAIAALLVKAGRSGDLAPGVTLADLQRPDRHGELDPGSDFVVVEDAGRLLACGALWDQTSFKQVVVRSPAPAWGFLNRLRRRPDDSRRHAFPDYGSPLRAAFLSHVAVEGDDPELFLALVSGALREAERRRLAHLVVTLAEDDPLGAEFRRKVVSWPLRVGLVALGLDPAARAGGEVPGRRPLRPDLAFF